MAHGTSESEVQQLVQALKQARDSGLLDTALKHVLESSPEVSEEEQPWDVVSGGAMHDGSKRRKSPPRRETPSRAAGSTPAPVMPANPPPPMTLSAVQWSELEAYGRGMLPPGIDSMQAWSNTLLCFGKLAAEELSYLDLVLSNEEEKIDYVDWICSHVNSKYSSQFQDVAAFVKIFGKVIKRERGIRFPGSKTIRKFKK